MTERQKPDEDKRDQHGRFAPGCRGGPGNPHAVRYAAMREALLSAATPERMTAMANALMIQAEQGDVPSAKLIFDYVMQKPVAESDIRLTANLVDLQTPAAELTVEQRAARLEYLMAEEDREQSGAKEPATPPKAKGRKP